MLAQRRLAFSLPLQPASLCNSILFHKPSVSPLLVVRCFHVLNSCSKSLAIQHQHNKINSHVIKRHGSWYDRVNEDKGVLFGVLWIHSNACILCVCDNGVYVWIVAGLLIVVCRQGACRGDNAQKHRVCVFHYQG